MHPLGGWSKDDDVPLAVRISQHQALLDDGTLDKESTILAVWPSPMYLAGPTEVIWHASSRVNCGITHFIVGRDPAGVMHPDLPGTPCYDPWHGQKLLVQLSGMLENVKVMPFKVAAYNSKMKQMEFMKEGERNLDHKMINGSDMRAMAKAGNKPPEGFMSAAGWEKLSVYYSKE